MFGLSKRVGIDLGTANSLVYLAGQGIVLNEPTVVAITTDDHRVLAVGNEAKEMLGRTPGNILALRPMRDGVIADFVITEAMIRYFLDKVCGTSRLFKPEVMVCAPAGVTSVEKRAILDATLQAGAKVAFLIDEPLAAAIGAKIPIANPSGNMIIDIGGGTTEAAVVCLGGVVVHSSVRVGGNKIDEAIQNYIRKKHNLIIGERMAEEVKIQLGSATKLKPTEVARLPASQRGEPDGQTKMEVRGRDGATGLPKTVEITPDEVTDAISDTLTKIVGAAKGVLEQIPPELASDIIDKGIVMSGGTALLRNLDRLMTENLGVPVSLAENPLLCVVLGTGLALENLDLYKRSVSKR